MIKNVMKRIGRRGATAAVVLAMAAGAVGVSAGSASADDWYSLNAHPNNFHVGVYQYPNSYQGKVAGVADLSSFPGTGDVIYLECWTRGENISAHGNVWYRIGGTNYRTFPDAYVYGAFVDRYWNFHNGLRPC
ncbi:hypothetical protein [Kitasatospora sp. NPDC094011]|uniref:hypothetical protein n=1 Tax=Kitasatospora sp. NPDC094011 TaxID=3364090 RepID=UPI00382EFEB7